MPRLMLLVPALLLAASGTSAQNAGGGVATPQVMVFHSVGGAGVGLPAATHDMVVSRLLSFDRNGDGTIRVGDLPERMQPVMARGDTNGDGLLDAAEIAALVRRSDSAQRTFFGGSYGFADQFSFSSRSHIEGAVEDLKLPEALSERALAIAASFVDRLEAEARAELRAELGETLTPDQIASFEEQLDAQFEGRFAFRAVGPSITAAVKALTRYMELVKLTPDTRADLLADLRDTLDEQQQTDLLAALERRPMMRLGNHPGAPGGARLQIQR